MHTVNVIIGLMATASASKALLYTIPRSFQAAASNCTLPAKFVVTDFITYTDETNSTLNTVCLEFSDPDTNIKTTCQQNSTSTPSGPSKNRYACDDANVAFIYQTTGVAGLTMIERACPGGTGTQLEASGLVTPQLECSNSTTGVLCHAEPTSIQGDFDSLEPIRPKAPTRRSQRARRG
ncbi:hypothetical protein F4777DRAFT_543972 [Nemania sp. FL0916]|nr:hypothetical protein F4777DRAFT_543972 [Nemania sp. FL0916]